MAILQEVAMGDDGDFLFANGDFVVLTGAEAVAQRVAVRLRALKGEWRTDTLRGTPWLQDVIGIRGVSLPLIQSIVRARMEGTQDVDEVQTF